LDKEGEKITLLWVLEHIKIPGNEGVDEEAKMSLAEKLLSTEKYPSQDLINYESIRLK
jgi:ribonuclease HI